MKIQTVDGRTVDHRRIRRTVYKTLRVIRLKGYGQPDTGGVDGNIRRFRNLALYRLKNRLRIHQNKLNVVAKRQ